MPNQKGPPGALGTRTNFHAQIITTPTSDTPGTSILLHFDNKRYLFGEFTEGTQRACIQRSIGLKKVRGMFLAGKTPWNNGGLIGMILTMADVQHGEVDENGKRPRLNIHAGPMQLHSLACARRFVFRTGMPLSVHEVDVRKNENDPKPIHEDENIRVWALASQNTSLETDDGAIEEAQMKREQELRNKVVNNMFDSSWRRDQLFEAVLKDIKLPAVVWVRDPDTKSLVTYPVFDLDKTPLDPDTVVLVRNPWPASTVEELPQAQGLPLDVAMSYIVKGHPQRGTFDPKKAKELGLKPGRKYAELVAGNAVQSDDGNNTTITPEMVLSPGRLGRGIAFFDVPSAGHLEDLVRQLQCRSDQLLDGVEAAVWITKGNVLQSPQLKELLHKLSNMKHIISEPEVCHDYIAYDSTALSSGRLNKIAPTLFSVPRFDNEDAYFLGANGSPTGQQTISDSSHIIAARRGLKVLIEPNMAIDESEVASNLESASFAPPLQPAVQELLPAGSSLTTPGAILGIDLDEPEIITLGTGSAAPSKYRNVSAVLLRMPNGLGNYLFDCGEGTLGQLKRIYTPHQLDEILFNLRAIWISHLHADHHLGTVTVLRAVHETVQRLSSPGRSPPSPPYLISEVNMTDYINEYQSVLGLSSESLCTPLPCDPFQGLSFQGKPFDIGAVDPYIKELRTVKVSHCHGAQAISVTFKDGFKFSYSGDCRPSESFCKIGAGSDVLVHEATFDDGMEGDARAKKHSTTGEAVGVALGMKAKNLILTHFSQRYQKMPVFSSVKMPELVSEEDMLDDVDAEMTNGTNGDDESHKLVPSASGSSWVEPEAASELPIAVAFDLMRIKASQIKEMKKLFPAISKMFELQEEEKDNARREAADQQKAEIERRLQVREQAMAKNRQKKDHVNREKQTELNKENKSKRNRKRGPRDITANGTDAQAAADTARDAPRTQKAAVNGIDAGERDHSNIAVEAKSTQIHDDHGNQMQESSVSGGMSIDDATNGATNGAEVDRPEGMSPLKRRKTEQG